MHCSFADLDPLDWRCLTQQQYQLVLRKEHDTPEKQVMLSLGRSANKPFVQVMLGSRAIKGGVSTG